MMSSLEKPFGTSNHNIYTCQYPLYNICLSITSIFFSILGSLYLLWMETNHQKQNNGNFLHLLLSNWQPHCLCQGNPVSSRKPLGTTDYNFYTHQYWLCGINFPAIVTQNHCGRRIVIPGHECLCFHNAHTLHRALIYTIVTLICLYVYI